MDDGPENPREWDNVGTLWCFHKRYTLGDDIPDWAKEDLDWDELIAAIKDHFGQFFYLSVYMYDHGGITISTEPFSDPWDSGLLGLIFCTTKKMEDKGITSIEQLMDVFKGEISTYDSFLKGEVYGYVVYDEDGVSVDSCWGFIGDSSYCLSEGSAVAQKERSWREKFEESMVNLFEDKVFA